MPGHFLPTIQIRDGQLPRAVRETEAAVLSSGAAIFARAGCLVYPAGEVAPTAGGGKTVMARLTEFTFDSFIEPVAESAIFQRYNIRKKDWADVDPPEKLVRVVLARDGRWSFPRVAGIITTPTLRADGSLLDQGGYDLQTELFLWPSVALPAMKASPTREDALEALMTLKELFGEFTFARTSPPIDLSVAVSSLIATLLRGSLPTAPITLVRASTPGTGKSYLVDVISIVATGRLCPVITSGKSIEEVEKRIGSILLAGSPIVSLDNITHDLGGELLCQMTERPIVRVRILGRSEMPDCECHTMVFATGNNIGFAGDMVRRGLTIDLEALDERPELRRYQHDALAVAGANRGLYIAAALTVARAYLAAGCPYVVDPFGSYAQWSRSCRAPLVWLGEPDPCDSIEEIRAEDPELMSIRELFSLWPTLLAMRTDYVVSRIVEIAEEDAAKPRNLNTPELKNLILRVARGKDGRVSLERLGRWLKRISGRTVLQRRLVRNTAGRLTAFRLEEV
jgi:putative DNA primase/helicase